MFSLRLKGLLVASVVSILLNLAGTAFAAAYNWKPVVVPAGGCITGIIYSPIQQNLIYARTDMGGAYRWDNSNSVWIPLTDWQSDWNKYGIESLAADPQNANVVYASIGQTYSGGNGAFIASSDQGNTWTESPLPVKIGANDGGNFVGERLAIDPHLTSILFLGTRYDGLWKSINSGANWAKVSSFPVNGDAGNGIAWVVFGSSGINGSATQTIYAGVEAVGSGNSNVYRSTDGGATWAVVPGGPSGMVTVRASLGSDGTLWMTFNESNACKTGQIWKLNTATSAWTNATPSNGPPSGQGGYCGISVDAQNPQHAAISTYYWWGGPDKCFQTNDGGNTWTVVAHVQNGWDSGPFPTYNINGAAWTHFCSPYSGGAWLIQCIRIDPFNSNKAIYTTGGGLWSTTNLQASPQPAGITWTFTDYGIEQTAVLFICPSYKPGVFFSALGDISGMRYTNLDLPAPTNYCNPQVGNTNCIDFAENNANVVARVGNSGATNSDVAFSSDNGQTWAPSASAPPGYTTNTQMRSVAVAADGSRTLVCPNNGYGNPAFTTNSGASWTACNGLPSGSDLAADRVNASVFYATNGNNLYRSSDGGANFSVVNSTGGGIPRAVFGITDEVWVANGSGLFRFTNAGATKAAIANVSSANSVGFGKAAPAQSHPALYLSGTVGGTFGYYRCDDGLGASWVRINDSLHQYGGAGWCGGDQGVYGRMYIGTNGRGTLYCDSSPGTPTPTPTFTSYAGTPTRTPTVSATPSPTPTLTPVCGTLIDGFETLNNNGTWSGGSALRSIVPAGTAPAGAVTQGGSCMQVSVTTGSGYNSSVMALGGSTPGALSSYLQLKMDVYMPAGMVDAGYNQMLLVADCSACPNGAGTGIWYQSISDSPDFTAGPQTLTFNINFAAGGLPLTATVSSLNFILNQGSAHVGAFYIDNLRLVNPCGLPTATPSASATPSPSATRTNSPSATLSASPTRSPTATMTPSPTLSSSPSPTLSPSASPTSTPTGGGSSTASPTRSSSPTATLSASPTRSLTVTMTLSPTVSASATASATASVSPAFSPTATPSVTSYAGSATDSPTTTSSPTATAVPATSTPSATGTATANASPSATVSATGSTTPAASATASQTGTPMPTASATPGLPSATVTPMPTGSPTTTLTPLASPTASPTGSPVATPTSTPSGTRTPTPTPSVTLTIPAAPSSTSTPSMTAIAPSPSVTGTAPGTTSGGPLVIDSAAVLPNPVTGDTAFFRILMEGPADEWRWSIYSVAMAKCAEGSRRGPIASGWQSLPVSLSGLPNGLYYMVLTAARSGGQVSSRKMLKMMVMR